MATLPPGQHAREDFPRFGLNQFANRIPDAAPLAIRVVGDLESPLELVASNLEGLPRVEQTSDLHCVTTWSATNLAWGGVRFLDFYERLVKPHATAVHQHLHIRCADGFRMRLPIEDALADGVLLADTLNGEPLPLIHGGPCRFVAPDHYGYKNPKHVTEIALTHTPLAWKSPTPLGFMEHPRARVHLEERGRFIPGWMLRPIYRPLIETTIRDFRRAWSRGTTSG